MKTNNYTVAKQQAQHLIKAGVEIPETIKEEEKDMYHVLLVKKVAMNKRTLTAVVDSEIKTFHKRTWQKIKQHLSGVGIEEFHVIHDPTIEVKETKPVVEPETEPEAEEPATETVKDEPTEEVEDDLMALDIKDLKDMALAQGYEGKLNVGKKVFVEYLQSV